MDDDFINLLYNFDRRKVWKNRVNIVLENWQSKNLKFNNEDLKRLLNINISEIKSTEIDLKPYGQEIITLLN